MTQPSFRKRLTIQVTKRTHDRVKAVQETYGFKSQEAVISAALDALEQQYAKLKERS